MTAAYNELQDHAPEIRDFVNNGGRYLGFCLGAFLAGNSPGFDLLPSGASTDAERKMDNSQVTGTEDTIIQVDWTFRTKVSAFSRGETAKAQWIYFQDGAVINGLPDDGNHTILGRYSQNGNVAASLTPYGKGWVAVTGPHPEAPKDWCKFAESCAQCPCHCQWPPYVAPRLTQSLAPCLAFPFPCPQTKPTVSKTQTV